MFLIYIEVQIFIIINMLFLFWKVKGWLYTPSSTQNSWGMYTPMHPPSRAIYAPATSKETIRKL